MAADANSHGPPLLDVRVGIEGAFALDVALEAPAGFTLVSGPSGSGKSTLLGAIAGFVRPARGKITLGDATWFDAARGVHVAPQHRRVAMVFQSLALFPHLTAVQNVAYGAQRSLDRQARRALAVGLLERLRVQHLADRKPRTFSGGEAQRVALARALATNPSVVLLDEPFSALEPPLRRDLAAEIRGVLRDVHIPVIVVTHQPEEVRAPGDRFVVLAGGKIADRGAF